MGTLSGAYTDPRYQTAVPFGRRSHWLQMWRSYLETVPAAALLAGVGTDLFLSSENVDVVVRHLATNGIRRARLEIGWNTLDYVSEQPAHLGNAPQILLACRRYGIRPLILLNGNDGSPCPNVGRSTTLAAPLVPGARVAQLSSTAGIVLGYTGLSYLPPQGLMAGHLITALSGTLASLSQPYSGAAPLAAGSAVTLHTLKYRPVNAAGTADYAATIAGWQTYVRTIARWAAGLLQRSGFGDLGFDLEVWNELIFGSRFLDIAQYYSPTPYGTHADGTRIMADTARLWTAYPADFAGVGLVDGFGNTTPWPSAGAEAPPVSGISFHPYGPDLDLGPGHPRAGTAIDAQFAVDTSGYEPQYHAFFPEYFLNGIQTESHTRNVGPLGDQTYFALKGRYARGDAAPCWGWVTECGASLAVQDVDADLPTALYWKAKHLLRVWLGWLGKGTQAILPYAVKDNGDQQLQQALESFLAYARGHSTYPDDDGPYTSPCYAALRRALATIGHAADPVPADWGTGQGRGVRALSVDALSDAHDQYQFGSDGTAAHPTLYNRDCFYIQPLQANPRRLVFIYYVMTRDTLRVYDPTRSGGAQYDLPEAQFTLTLGGLDARGALIAAYDPLGDRDVPVGVQAATPTAATLVLTASDRPYLLTIQERTSGAVAASSYLQNARLAWMLGVSYPAPPAAQYVGLFAVAPTNTTAGTELSAGNYQRAPIGLSNAAAPTVTPTGATGGTTYAYQVIKKNAGGSTLGAGGNTGSAVATITNGNGTLSSSNYNAVSWPADAGAASFDVLKWSGTAWTLLGNTSGSTMNDTGQATQAYTVPTQNTTGWTTIVAGTTETISNAVPLVWPVANVNWGTAVAMAIFDAPSAGNMLDFAGLTSSQIVNAGSQLSFPAGQLILGEA